MMCGCWQSAWQAAVPFQQADADIKNILISTSKITGRAERIEKVELAPTETPQQLS
jgi:hypothetical protein